MSGEGKSARNLDRMRRGTYGAGGEILDFTYYDSGILAVATAVHRLFTVALGGGAPAKTLDRTNMTMAGQIPTAQRLIVKAIKIFYVTANALVTADIQTFYTMLRQATLEIVLPGKDTMGTWNLIELFGASTLTAAIPTVAGDNIPVISPRYHGILPLNTPLVLAANTPFEVRITHHAPVVAGQVDDLIFVGLSGTLQRGN